MERPHIDGLGFPACRIAIVMCPAYAGNRAARPFIDLVTFKRMFVPTCSLGNSVAGPNLRIIAVVRDSSVR